MDVGDLSSAGPPIAAHWNGGRRWRLAPMPAGGGVLLDVVAVARDDAWAVGARGNHALIERWDGLRWLVVRLPDGLKTIATTSVSVGAGGKIFTNCLESADERRWQLRFPP